MKNAGRRDDAAAIFKAGIMKVDPGRMVTDHCSIDGNVLSVDGGTEKIEYDLNRIENLLVIGAGKAGAKMALGLEDVLGGRITKGCVAVKYGHVENLSRIRLIESGHPVPDENSVKAAQEIMDIAEQAGPDDLVINLISGGGSSIITAPLDAGGVSVSLEDLRAVTGELLACGARIDEINCIRKHLSMVKGGRLAQLTSPAKGISLILSDVVGDDLNVIASGPTVPDKTTFADAYDIFTRYRLWPRVPETVREILKAGTGGHLEDTPKPGDPVFERFRTVLVGTNISAVNAAADKAAGLGYNPMILGSRITGEAREIAKVFSGMAKDARQGRLPYDRPLCIIGGGETTVTLLGEGKGGRNQEMAVSFANEFMSDPEAAAGITFLSGGTDGNDGPTDAAGGFADAACLNKASGKGLDPGDFIQRSDAYHFLRETGSLLITGPTNTNVCDIQILIIE